MHIHSLYHEKVASRLFRILILLILSCPFLLYLTDASATSIVIAKNDSSLTLDPQTATSCQPTTVENYARLTVINVSTQQQPEFALLTQQFEVGTGCFEGYQPAHVRVSAQRLNIKTGQAEPNILWSMNSDGIQGAVQSYDAKMLYRIDMPGCCGASDTAKYYSLLTGKLIASATGHLLSVNAIDEHATRFIGVEDNIASSRQGDTTAIATIFLGDNQAQIETLSVKAPTSYAQEDWWIESLHWRGQHTSQNNLTVKQFMEATLALRLKCRCAAEDIVMQIPLNTQGFANDQAIITGLDGVSVRKTRREKTN
jgi:hypothetical protein